MASRYPVAYLRRSSADDENPGDVSREAQEAAVRELAHRDGYNGNLRVFVDWDRSADEAKEARRTAFLDMLAAIERGEVTAVYAYALDRLYRSMRTFVRLTDAAKAHGARVVTLREGVLGGDGSPMAQAFAQITAVFSELELNTAKARARGAIKARQARGDRLGHPGYGWRHTKVDGRIVREPDPARPIGPVLAAYHEAGTVNGACRLLNARGIPSPKGSTWGHSALFRVLEDHAPELLPMKAASGRRVRAPAAMFGQLLRCHCGRMLTPNVARGQYYCSRGNAIGRPHGRSSVLERNLLPWVKEEAARLRIPFDAIREDADNGVRRAALEAKRERIIDLYADGTIDKPERQRRLGEVDAEISRLEAAGRAAGRLVSIPTLDWSWPPEAINAVLRAIWTRVDMGPDLLPVRAEWTVPEWRS